MYTWRHIGHLFGDFEVNTAVCVIVRSAAQAVQSTPCRRPRRQTVSPRSAPLVFTSTVTVALRPRGTVAWSLAVKDLPRSQARRRLDVSRPRRHPRLIVCGREWQQRRGRDSGLQEQASHLVDSPGCVGAEGHHDAVCPCSSSRSATQEILGRGSHVQRPTPSFEHDIRQESSRPILINLVAVLRRGQC